MNEVQVFNNPIFGKLPIIEINGKEYFGATDAAKSLSFANQRDAIKTYVDEDGVVVHDVIDNLGRKQSKKFVTEAGLYALIFGAARQGNNKKIKALAKQFQKWVFEEVLPSIRKTGGYQVQPQFNVPQTLPEALRLSADLAEQNAEMKPKAIFADAVTSSKTSILVGDLAKLLKQNGIDMGGRRLFEWLRNKGYLIRRNGADYNSPTQRSMEQGLFEIKESSHINGDGVNVIKKTPKVTGKGQQYFINKFLGADQTELDMEVM